jgi:hypothetical protein
MQITDCFRFLKLQVYPKLRIEFSSQLSYVNAEIVVKIHNVNEKSPDRQAKTDSNSEGITETRSKAFRKEIPTVPNINSQLALKSIL